MVPTLVLLFLCAACTAPRPSDRVPEHETLNIASKVLSEPRVINVWLPPSYGDGEGAFPVLYMPDGGVAEDFPHIAHTIAGLVERGEIAPVLVVGIENTERRRDMTSLTTVEKDREVAPVIGGAAQFRAFIKKELIPEIERRYRTTPRRAFVGESLAGMFVVETFFHEPELFERSIAMSPSLWWNDHGLVRQAEELLPAATAQPRTLWFTAANETDIFPHTAALADVLREHAPDSLSWTYDPRPDEEHHTIFRATKEEAFRTALWRKDDAK